MPVSSSRRVELDLELGQPAGHAGAASGRGDDDVGVDDLLGAVDERPHAGDAGEVGRLVGAGDQPVDRDAVEERDVILREHRGAQHPLEGGAATGDGDQVLVARAGLAVEDRGRQVVGEAHLGGAGFEEAGEDVGVVVAQEVVEPGEQGMGVADLGRAPPVPLEGLVGRGRRGRGVPLEDRDPVAGAAQRQARHRGRPHRRRSPPRGGSSSDPAARPAAPQPPPFARSPTAEGRRRRLHESR